MLLEIVFSRAARLHPIRWLAEVGDATFELPEVAPLPAQFVNVPVDDALLQEAVDDAVAALLIPQIYEHLQAPSSAFWIVNHNLGRSPASVRVLSAGGVEISCDVVETSINQLTISLIQPQIGRALVI